MDADRFAAFLAALTAAPSRRTALRLLSGLGLAGLFGQGEAKKKKRKRKKQCARAGQSPNKKHKRCCAGLVPDSSGVCASPASSPSPGCEPGKCAPTACGSVPDGCGGTLSCGCPANQICLRSGVCQPCTVTCTGTPAECGAALQTAMQAGGTVYVCPGTYPGTLDQGFTLTTSVSVIGAGEGDDPASNTILEANGGFQVLLIIDFSPGDDLVVLERLRFIGGASGRGIQHGGTTLRMTECTVSGSTSVNEAGGGIVVRELSTAELTRCTIRDNHATDINGSGGGIWTRGTTTLTDCLVEANTAQVAGGGLYIVEGTTTLTGSTQVRGNHAVVNTSSAGGGIYVSGGTLEIAETCRVTDNETLQAGQGGGIFNAAAADAVTLQGTATSSPIVVNNCHENCVGPGMPNCAAMPVSCPP